MSFSHLNPIEAVWLVASALALFFAVLGLIQSGNDQGEAEKVNNGLREARQIVADGYVFRNRIRVAIFAWWATLGVGYGFFDLPDIPRLAGVLGLLVTAVGWTVIGAQETAERRALTAVIAKTAAEKIAEVLAGQMRDDLKQTAENTGRVADYTDELREQNGEARSGASQHPFEPEP